MTTLILKYPRGGTKELVKSSFESTKGIKQYNDGGSRIVGKTGMSLWSYGESVTVEIPINQTSETETMISVTADKEVAMNITANPDKYKSRFLSELENIREYSTGNTHNIERKHTRSVNTKEVSSANELRDGTLSAIIVISITLILCFIFANIIIIAVMP